MRRYWKEMSIERSPGRKRVVDRSVLRTVIWTDIAFSAKSLSSSCEKRDGWEKVEDHRGWTTVNKRFRIARHSAQWFDQNH